MEGVRQRTEQALARSTFYSLLSAGFSYPRQDVLEVIQKGEFTGSLRKAASVFEEEKGLLAAVEAFSKAVEREFSCLSLAQWEGVYNRVFSMGLICPHHETDYSAAHVFMKSQEMADISGFYQAFGFRLSENEKELADFIGTELEFMHVLTYKEYYALEKADEDNAGLCRKTQEKFLKSHLGTWVKAFSKSLSTIVEWDVLSTLCRLLEGFVAFDCRYLGVSPVEVVLGSTARPGPEAEAFTCGGGLEDTSNKWPGL